MEDKEAFTVDEFSKGGSRSKGFNVYEIAQAGNASHTHTRRDFYKIVLVTEHVTIRYGNTTIEIDDTFLFFANPAVPHSVQHHSKVKKGYACLFTEAFVASRQRDSLLQNSPLFRVSKMPVIQVNAEQQQFIGELFRKMIAVHQGDYDFKEDLLKTYIELILHEALRIEPSPTDLKQTNAAARVTYAFTQLMERQFPIMSTEHPLRMRTPQDYASVLALHVNYLNRAVKEFSGKPTSMQIAERIAAEAKALLDHTDWPIADIALGLGFEYPTYFMNFFKKTVGVTPRKYKNRKG